MPRVRHCRPVLCLLLAVATAIGSLPVSACACPSQAPPEVHRIALAIEVQPACCSACQTHCCGDAAAPKVSASCSCVVCECPPGFPPADSAPPPTPIDSGILQFASAPPAPPALLDLPNAVFPRAGEVAHPPPIDLVTLLSRLTC